MNNNNNTHINTQNPSKRAIQEASVFTCNAGSCDAFEGLKRTVNEPKSPDEIRYTELWTQIVMPKILEGKEFRWTELPLEELKRRQTGCSELNMKY